MSHRLVVVGAGYAGLLAAKRLARKLRRSDVTITLVNASDRFVERVGSIRWPPGSALRRCPCVNSSVVRRSNWSLDA